MQFSHVDVHSIYKLYINTVYLFLRDAKLLWGMPLVYKLYIYEVYLLLRDAKLVMRDTKLPLRDANVLLRDSV